MEVLILPLQKEKYMALLITITGIPAIYCFATNAIQPAPNSTSYLNLPDAHLINSGS